MAKRVFESFGLTFNQQALNVAATSSQYMSLRSNLASQLVDILEILISGTASASQIGAFAFCRASTNAATETALSTASASDGALYPGATAIGTVIISAIAATTGPTLSQAITDAKLNLGLNTFGGIIRWNAAPTQQWQLLGSTAPGANSALANLTAGGGSTSANANAHIMYEPY